ncbi:MAG: hypothetical protein H0U74_16135, partial [Bradymonadaceae bacterium]|nr:hypothetical protein [Lujinxingiaceae bacterium]
VEEAAIYAQMAADLPDAPDHLTLLATSFHRKVARMRAGHRENASEFAEATPEEIEYLLRLYYETESDDMRNFVRHRLQSAGAEEQILERSVEYRAQFMQIRGDEFSYLSPALFCLVSTNCQ